MRDRSFNKLVQLLETVDTFKTEAHDEEHSADHEVHMARAQVADLIANAVKVQAMLQAQELDADLEAWIQSKLTLANDYLNSVRSSMEQGFRDEDGVEYDADAPKVVEIEVSDDL